MVSCSVAHETEHDVDALIGAVTNEVAESVKRPGGDVLGLPANGASGKTVLEKDEKKNEEEIVDIEEKVVEVLEENVREMLTSLARQITTLKTRPFRTIPLGKLMQRERHLIANITLVDTPTPFRRTK